MSATRIHATTVAIGGRGVMIVGPSGAGKSDLALRLIDRGAVLVSDDYTECAARDGDLMASAPPTIAGKIEVRGLGIVDMPHAGPTAVAMVVTLADTIERMPERGATRIAGVERCLIAIDAFEASAPIKVEIALSRLVEEPR
ncbi:aldolase [Sphingomonas sp. AR_OL41]|jgi:serine kinase of HPr protein (carbohydrate metabolism regulator)|uniref:HPr kinase/phosphorylase n=1 Tax=Sphingomonas sp. AR_OL41 TaxID=3042729 RepID=UPI00247FED59|nr:aldolase [Sphingomonas sp. AR_OL41]MDH7970874.1 aldolase [Sphingomonas sp. AR_OL41]